MAFYFLTGRKKRTHNTRDAKDGGRRNNRLQIIFQFQSGRD